MAINDKKEFSKTPTSYSPTVALIGWKHFKNSYYKNMIDYEKNCQGSSRETDMVAILKKRQARGISSKNKKITPFST